jgi:hypothetical protein
MSLTSAILPNDGLAAITLTGLPSAGGVSTFEDALTSHPSLLVG